MAFDPERLNVMVDSIGGGALRIHHLATDDTNGTIVVAGYLRNVAWRGVRLNDLIVITFEQTNENDLGTVINVNAAGDATIAIEQGPLAMVVAATSGIPPEGVPARRGQFMSALEASGAGRVATIQAAVPSDPGDATNIAWNHTTFVTPTSALAQFVKTTLSLSDAQLAAILTSSRTIVE